MGGTVNDIMSKEKSEEFTSRISPNYHSYKTPKDDGRKTVIMRQITLKVNVLLLSFSFFFFFT